METAAEDKMEVNPLEMDDAAFLELGAAAFEDYEEEPGNDDSEDNEEEDEGGTPESSDSADEDEEEAGDSESEEENSDQDESDDEDDDKVDYEAVATKLFAPFKANGKEMKIDNVDDAIRLMQQGANYNQKMAAMKPGLKALRMLEKASLLDENKLSFLIDLDKKDPKAIAKLLKDGEIDPSDLDLDDGKDYESKNHKVSDAELRLDEVLDRIKDSDTYPQTIELISTKWDEKSKQIVAGTPELIEVINTNMETGVHELISTEVERERMFGGLSGLTDIEAYKQVGDKLYEQGKFDHLFDKKDTESEPVRKKITKTNKSNESERTSKRKALSPTKQAVDSSKKGDEELNPLNMSDEEFMKRYDPLLM